MRAELAGLNQCAPRGTLFKRRRRQLVVVQVCNPTNVPLGSVETILGGANKAKKKFVEISKIVRVQ